MAQQLGIAETMAPDPVALQVAQRQAQERRKAAWKGKRKRKPWPDGRG